MTVVAARATLPPMAERKKASRAGKGKAPVSLHGAGDLDTPAKREAVANALADDMLAAIDKDREAAGLPPLK